MQLAPVIHSRLAALLDRLTVRGIIAAAIALRLVFCYTWAEFVDVPRVSVPVEGATYWQAGADGYLQIARTLWVAGRYAFAPDAAPAHNRPPVQPLFMLVFGAWSARHWYLVFFVGNALLWWGVLALVNRLCLDLGIPRRWRMLALLGTGFHPYLVFISKTPTFMNTAIFVLTLAISLAIRIPRRPLRGGALAGLAAGVAALTHGVLLPLPVLFAGFVLARRALPLRVRLGSAALLVALAAAVVAPWTIRNIATFGRFIPVVTGNGFHYWKGSRVYFGDRDAEARVFRERTGRELRVVYFGAENADDDRVLWNAALDDMRARPLRALARLPIGTLAWLAPWDGGMRKAVVAGALNVPFVLLVLALLLRVARRRALAWSDALILATVLWIATAYAFFLAWGSYFNMVLPACIVLCCSLAQRAGGPVAAGAAGRPATRAVRGRASSGSTPPSA